MKPRNFVAKHMRQFNTPQIVPNKRRKDLGSRVACLEEENASECAEMQVEMASELIDEVKTECLSHEEE